MSAGQSKHVPVRSNEFELSRSPLDGPPNKSARLDADRDWCPVGRGGIRGTDTWIVLSMSET